MANLNYQFGKNRFTRIGASYYYGNSSDNRPKPDLAVDANVKIIGAYASYFEHPFRITSQFIWGEVQNSEQISVRNSKLPNALGVKRTAVAKNALGFSIEAGYDIMTFFSNNKGMQLYPFFRYDFYDSMYETVGSVTDNPRWERSSITAGVNWFIIPQVILKAQYSSRKLGSDNIDIVTGKADGKEMENTFSLGLGFTL